MFMKERDGDTGCVDERKRDREAKRNSNTEREVLTEKDSKRVSETC